MAFEYRFTPLPSTWPGKATPPWQQQRARLKRTWSEVLRVLEREVAHLRGVRAELAVDVDARHLRNDGQLRADARPRTPGVVVSFANRDGRLQFPCDTFTFWQDNVDARPIAASVRALLPRALDALAGADTVPA